MTEMTKIMYPKKDRESDEYEKLLEMMKFQFGEICSIADGYLYKTDATDLYQLFLDNLPKDAVQHYTCNACRRFVNKYGNLVTITENGDRVPAIWPKYGPEIFDAAVAAVRDYLTTKAKVVSVFYTDHATLGTPQTGDWCHMSVQINRRLLMKAHPGVYGDCGEKMSASQSDYVTIRRAISDYSIDVVKEAMKLINSGALFRSEKVKNTCLAFLNLLIDIDGEIPAVKAAKVWRYIASATDSGYLHIRSSVIGTLLDDIKDGVDMDTIVKKFNDKMDPMHYQRPQAAPSTGNIQRAEEIFAELGLTSKSLERRFATLDDLETIWKPQEGPEETVEESGSIFGHLKDKAKNAPKITKVDGVIDRGTMTWNKFYSDILPDAKSIKMHTDYISPSTIDTILTAANPEGRCVFRHGNHATHYMYNNDRAPLYAFNIKSTMDVAAICYDPMVWGKGDDFEKDTIGVNFILKGAKDRYIIDGGKKGSAIFPEDLIPELREVRSVIAAYSAEDTIKGGENASATGVRLQHGLAYGKAIRLTVETNTMGTLSICIDRWE